MFATDELELERRWLASVRADLRRIDELRHEIWQLKRFQERPECSRQEFHWAKLLIQSMNQELTELGEDIDS